MLHCFIEVQPSASNLAGISVRLSPLSFGCPQPNHKAEVCLMSLLVAYFGTQSLPPPGESLNFQPHDGTCWLPLLLPPAQPSPHRLLYALVVGSATQRSSLPQPRIQAQLCSHPIPCHLLFTGTTAVDWFFCCSVEAIVFRQDRHVLFRLHLCMDLRSG